MSAIAGILSLDHRQVEAEPAERMAALMAWRGPDDEGSYRSPEGRVALAARRLAALDDSREAGLPLTNETLDVWLVLDGEVLNHRALRHSLELVGHRFRSGSDTEVALHAYEQWGLDFLRHLQGAFALALWDDRRDRLVLARDRLGRKPLYVAEYGGKLAFASAIRPLLDGLGIPPRIDPMALAQHLSLGWVPAPRTLAAGISKLGAGEMLVAERGAQPFRNVWGSALPDERRASAIRVLPVERQIDNLRTLLECSVADRMMGDGDVGTRLDPSPASGMVAAIMSRLAGRRVVAVSVLAAEGLDGLAAWSVRALAEAAGCDLLPVAVTAEEAATAASLLIQRLAEPVSEPSGLVTWLAARSVGREGMTALLAADGADEILLDHPAYQRVRPAYPGPLARLLPAPIRKMFGNRPSPVSVLADFSPFGEAGWPPLLGPAAAQLPSPPAPAATGLPRWLANDPLAAAGWIDLSWRGAEALCPVSDSASLSHGVQCRLPFLDEIAVSYGAAIPGHIRAPKPPRRQLLRRLASNLLKPSLANLPPVGGALPLGDWLAGPLGATLERAINGHDVFRNGLLSVEGARALMREHRSNGDRTAALWALLTLAEWCQALGLSTLDGSQPSAITLAHSRP